MGLHYSTLHPVLNRISILTLRTLLTDPNLRLKNYITEKLEFGQHIEDTRGPLTLIFNV